MAAPTWPPRPQPSSTAGYNQIGGAGTCQEVGFGQLWKEVGLGQVWKEVGLGEAWQEGELLQTGRHCFLLAERSHFIRQCFLFPSESDSVFSSPEKSVFLSNTHTLFYPH